MKNLKNTLTDDVILIIESSKENKNYILIKEKIKDIKNWEIFINLSYSHGVFPLVYHALKEHKDIIPQDIFLKLKAINMDIVKQNMLMTSELIKMIKLIKKNNLEVISFKGPTLSSFAYDDIVSRQYIDLDILVKEKDLIKIDKLLRSENYHPQNNIFDNKLKIKVLKDVSYFNSDLNVYIEIHWKLFSFYLNNSILNYHNTKTTEKFMNMQINSFDINFYIVYLSIHGSRHLWERIEWLVDINKLIYKNQELIDFDKIYEIAELSDNRKSVDLAFYLCKELFTNQYIQIHFTNDITSLANKNLENFNKNKNQSDYQVFVFHNSLYTKFSSKLKHLFNIFKINDRDLAFINTKYKIKYYLFKPIRIIKVLLK